MIIVQEELNKLLKECIKPVFGGKASQFFSLTQEKVERPYLPPKEELERFNKMNDLLEIAIKQLKEEELVVPDMMTHLEATLATNREFYKDCLVGEYECVLTYKRKNIKVTRKFSVNSVEGLSVEIKKQLPQIKTLVREERQAVVQCRSSVKEMGGMRYMMQAGVHTESGTITRLLNRDLVQEVRQEKAPRTLVPHVGVEIEFFTPVSRDIVISKLAVRGVSKHVQVKSDGSLESDRPGYHAHELTIVAPETEILDIVQKVCDILNNECKAYVNNTCGLHVHLDMRQRNAAFAYKALYESLECLYEIVPHDRRTNTRYCATNKTAIWEEAIVSSRYQAINASAYNKFKTIELRLHGASTNAVKITNWIKILVQIVNQSQQKSFKIPSMKSLNKDVSLFCDRYGLDTAVKTFMLARQAKFKDAAEDTKKDGASVA